MERSLVTLDTESATAGGAPHLLELAAVRVVAGEITDHFQSLVRPEVAVEAETTAVHGLSNDDVADAPDAGAVLAAFREWAGTDWLVAHDAGADAKVLGFEAFRHAVAPPPGPLIDTLPLAVRHIPEAPDHRLETLASVLELDAEQHHRALPDAVTCWKVLEECLERMGSAPIGLAELLMDARPTTIAAAMPSPARLPRRLRQLESAAREGRSVVLLYGEESYAPSRLPVLPRRLYQHRDHGYLEAECRRSGVLKTYRLDRVHRVLADA